MVVYVWFIENADEKSSLLKGDTQKESKHPITDGEKERHALENMLKAHRKGPDGYEKVCVCVCVCVCACV